MTQQLRVSGLADRNVSGDQVVVWFNFSCASDSNDDFGINILYVHKMFVFVPAACI